ncbi:iron-siderophore ABC transporter substrate-binding protein [Salinactinospora qingdaonensis]|uniref:ABC transporter substrate-binding protein n=1 Tax=Salinactinospora qingdaonensis TaxID=702744 RepID=A0ABP7FK70_9ACTN
MLDDAHRAPAWRLAGAATAIVAAAALTGCGGSGESDEGGSTAAESADTGAFPVSIEHTYGSTEITERPERIVTVGWSDEGTLLELGIVPVGIAESTFASEDGYLPWDVAKIEELGGELPTLINTDNGIPTEQVATLAPDLILGVQSGMQESEYEDLSQVAPTIPYLDQPWMTGWQEQTQAIGTAVGKPDEATALVAETEDYLAELAAEHPEFEGTSFVIGTMYEGEFAFYVEGEPRAELMKQLGFTPAEVTDELHVADGQFYGTLSMENADKIDAQTMVMWFNTAEDQQRIEDNEVFQQIPAVRDGGYIAFNDPALAMAVSTPNPLSLPWAMDEFVPELGKAAQGQA